MASYRAQFLTIQRANERTMSQLFRDLAAGIAADVARRADADGVVPRTATFELQRQSAERIRRLYLGRNRAGDLAPFETLANGRVIALAPYPQALWAAITAAVRLPVEENAAIITKRLPADILDVLRRARVDPFKAVGAKVAETTTVVGRRTTVVGGLSSVVEVEIFRPNPLATYEAPHTWVDPNGYRLSDRIWNVAAAERSRLDAYLDDSIKRGTGALTMAKELEQFLDPSRKTLTTNKPYGSKASYDAMRLARTEITRAHGQAQQVSAAMNPFVTGLKWVLSPRHPKPDVCDSYARGGPNGDGVYPLGGTPPYPAHPSCLCTLLNAMTPDPDVVITSLRDDIRKARADLVDKIGPVAVENFDRLLLGETLPPIVAQPAPVVALPVAAPLMEPVDDKIRYARRARVKQGDDAPAPLAPAVPVPGAPITAKGTHIADLLDTSELSTTKQSVQNGIDIIQRVHGDGDLPQIRVIQHPMGSNEGMYRGFLTDRDGNLTFTGRIEMNDNSTRNMATETFIHEFGHYLDDYLDIGLGSAAREAGLGKAIVNTPTYQRLKENKERANNPDGPDAYLADPMEVFARAYTQWVARRTRAPELEEIILRNQNATLRYWQDDEFPPIAKAMDKIFASFGYMTED